MVTITLCAVVPKDPNDPMNPLDLDVVTLDLSGTVTDDLADIVADGKADITKVMIEGVEREVRKVDGGAPTSLRPYPFKGEFGPVRVTRKLSHGANPFVVAARNMIGNGGSDSVTLNVYFHYVSTEVARPDGSTQTFWNFDRASITSIDHGESTPAGLVNPIRVFVDDASLTPLEMASKKALFFGQEFALKQSEGQWQLDRPFMAVARGPGVALPNVWNVVTNATDTVATFQGTERNLGWAYTANSPAIQYRYASGTTVMHHVYLSQKFDNLQASELVLPPWIFNAKESAAAPNPVKSYGLTLKQTASGRWQNVLWLKMELPKGFHTQVGKSKHVQITYKFAAGKIQQDMLDDNFEAVPLKVVICAIDGAAYESVRGAISGGRAPNLAKVFGDAINLERPALSAMPTVTFCNWPGVFSGQPPKDTGILGNAFFERDLAGVNPPAFPYASANDGQSVGALVNMPGDAKDNLDAVQGKLSDHARPTAESLYDKINAAVTEDLRCVSVNALYSRANTEGQGLKMVRTQYPTDWAYLGHNPATARNLDVLTRVRAIESCGISDQVENAGSLATLPDVLTLYFPGPDNVAHSIGAGNPDFPTWPGAPVGGGLLPSIRKHLEQTTDPCFGKILQKVILNSGHEQAVVFALVADHGLIAYKNDDAHNLVIEKENKTPELHKVFGALGLTLWRGGDKVKLRDADAVYSPNGGMAHIYLKGSDWMQPPSDARIDLVAQTIYNEAVGVGHIMDNPDGSNDLRGALGRNVAPNSNVPAILVRRGGFVKDYLWLTKDASGAIVRLPIAALMAATNANEKWPMFEARIKEMNAQERSGDIVLIMNGEAGFLTVLHGDGLNGWHGGPSKYESQVPLLFNFLGEDRTFLKNALPKLNPGALRNWHLTPALVNIVKATRD